MENLEEFIRENRKDLDKYEPPPENWKEIRRSLRNLKPGLVRWLSAAAVIIIILTAAVFHYKGENIRESTFISNRSDALIMNSNTQLKESEIYYNNLIKNLYSEAKPLLAGYPDENKELMADMSQIDSICTDIKKDLKDNVANQEVIEALINNYRIKIQILEDMLVLLKQNENNHGKNDSDEL